MVAHLASAKREVHAGGRHGTVIVAFTLGPDGHVISDTIAHGSGDPALDAAAKHLIEAAAPYPRPPVGAVELSFTLPIRFRP